MEEKKSKKPDAQLWKEILMCVLGIVICAIAVGFFKRAELGVDPFQSFVAGMDLVIPIDFGTLYVIINVVLLAFSLFFNRKMIGLGTLINLFLTGYIADFSRATLFKLFPKINFAEQLIFLAIGVIIMCLASSLYFTADKGVSTYDAVALTISGKWKIGKFKWVRIISDFICVGIGVGLYFLSGGDLKGIGSVVGIGTIITAFFMGPLIDFFNIHVARPMLGKN